MLIIIFLWYKFPQTHKLSISKSTIKNYRNLIKVKESKSTNLKYKFWTWRKATLIFIKPLWIWTWSRLVLIDKTFFNTCLLKRFYTRWSYSFHLKELVITRFYYWSFLWLRIELFCFFSIWKVPFHHCQSFTSSFVVLRNY